MSIAPVYPDMIESRDDLVTYLAQGCKSRDAWRIGTEHEKFVFHTADHMPLLYDGSSGIHALLLGYIQRFGWEPIMEGSAIIGLRSSSDGSTISLEPGGQFELSGAQLETLHQTHCEIDTHLKQARVIGEDLEIGFLGLGFSPKWTLLQTPSMPKKRYDIMTRYMPKVGEKGLDMMYRSCTVQVNLDFSSEADMIKKLRVALALQSVGVALFANSPFTEGRPNGFCSYRMDVWRYTDAHRTGNLPFVFENDMSFERYVDYALDVPMYFVVRDDMYIDVSGQSFRDFMNGSLSGLPDEKPTVSDWETHLSTIFPDVRVKSFLEIRGADSGPREFLSALPAFWVGLLYDQDVLDAAWDIVRDWTAHERNYLHATVPRMGLQTPFRGRLLQDVAIQAVELSRIGLKKRACLNMQELDETIFLDVLEHAARSGETPADRLLGQFHGPWNHDIDRIFDEEAY